jgi:hypothetical protein
MKISQMYSVLIIIFMIGIIIDRFGESQTDPVGMHAENIVNEDDQAKDWDPDMDIHEEDQESVDILVTQTVFFDHKNHVSSIFFRSSVLPDGIWQPPKPA